MPHARGVPHGQLRERLPGGAVRRQRRLPDHRARRHLHVPARLHRQAGGGVQIQ